MSEPSVITTSQGGCEAVLVLMYHSISAGPGPTCIPRETFRQQLEALDQCGYRVISMDDFVAWHSDAADLPKRAALVTFDDGFTDFADAAFPELHAHGWSATVYLPTEKLGGVEDWEGAAQCPRRLLTWEQVRELAREGIDFGSHSLTHADLTRLAPEAARREVRLSRDQFAQRLAAPPKSFAPPYGRSNTRVRVEIRQHYDVSVGTVLQRALRKCDRYDVPRVEMHYFRNIGRWRAFLRNQASMYFSARRLLRGARRCVQRHA